MQTISSLFKSKLDIPVSPAQRLFLKWFCIGCLLLMVFFVVANTIRDASQDKSKAYLVAQDFVSERLIRPSTAKFPLRSQNGVLVEYLGRHRYSISGYLDAVNTFGNSQRSSYKCIIRYTGTGEWICEAVSFE